MINNKKLRIFFLLTISTSVYLVIDNAYAHIPQDNKTVAPVQEWKNQQDNVKIQFSYSPDKPLLYTFTDLKFSIQDLKTGNHLKDLVISLTITQDRKIFFKFSDVVIQNGDLSLRVQFSEDGNYRAISQVSSADNTAIALASFNILVPLQPLGKFNADSLSSSLIPAGLVAISLSALVAAVIILSRKKNKQRKPSNEEGKEE